MAALSERGGVSRRRCAGPRADSVPRAAGSSRVKRSRGFTLIEVAMVIAIVGFLLGAILTPLSTQYKIRKNRDAERDLREVREAVVGYAVSRGRLPCPDTDVPPDGVEDCPTVAPLPGGEVFLVGRIPWVDLDVDPLDPWGRVLGYGVTHEFTNAALAGQLPGPLRLDLGDRGSGTVATRTDLGSNVRTSFTDETPVIVLSTGANGFGGYYLDGTYIDPPTAVTDGFDIGGDENENINGDNIAVRRVHTPRVLPCDDLTADSPPCEYDDVVTWISGVRIKGLLVQAGRLP